MKRLVIGVFAAVLLIGLAAVFPLPPRRVTHTDMSPDGKYVATFYWKPACVVGAITKDNPWIYLTVSERATGKVVIAKSCWGDTPDDDRLAAYVPWRKQSP
jgi:hypothetical protein